MDDEKHFDEPPTGQSRELDIFQESIMIRAMILEIGAHLNVMAAHTDRLDLSTVRNIRRRMQSCSAAIKAALDGDLG